MNAKLNFATPSATHILAAATLAAAIAIGILWTVVSLFQSRGAPLERLAAAECACAQQTFQSERETCMKQWLVESLATRIAIR